MDKIIVNGKEFYYTVEDGEFGKVVKVYYGKICCPKAFPDWQSERCAAYETAMGILSELVEKGELMEELIFVHGEETLETRFLVSAMYHYRGRTFSVNTFKMGSPTLIINSEDGFFNMFSPDMGANLKEEIKKATDTMFENMGW